MPGNDGFEPPATLGWPCHSCQMCENGLGDEAVGGLARTGRSGARAGLGHGAEPQSPLGAPHPVTEGQGEGPALFSSPDTSSLGGPRSQCVCGGGDWTPPTAEQQDHAGRSQWRPRESITSLSSVLYHVRCGGWGAAAVCSSLEKGAAHFLPVPSLSPIR